MTDCPSCGQEYDGWLVSVRIVQYLLLVVMEFECVCVCVACWLLVVLWLLACLCVLLFSYMGLSTFIFLFFFLFFSFFSATILSGAYLWNRYSQRLQIECAAWSCGLVVHCCLPSNSLRYFFFFNFFHFFRQDFVRAISLEPLLAETPK